MKQLSYHWYALYTKSMQEKKVYAEIIKRGFNAYLPLETKIKQWSDRKKKVEVPMIRSYVFVNISEKEYYDIVNITGAVRYVTFEGKAVAIPEWQIDAMKKMVEFKAPHYYSGERFLKGEMIIIESGPLKGYEGEVVKDNNGKNKIIIRIKDIGYSLILEHAASVTKKSKLPV
ncbi:MAG: UpxY family transcription antiterminator [Bacteroidetes bacterium]|nr:UpxY family transcription antiterminator [Bacteroidota bacterium]